MKIKVVDIGSCANISREGNGKDGVGKVGGRGSQYHDGA